MNEIKLSIVVPVYNVEKYLEACLDSLIEQNIPIANYEIICINDESTDNSLDILNKYADIYSNIKVISQKNKGLSGARNTGIQNAQGKYIMFVDSDDYLEKNCLSELVTKMEFNRLEVLSYNFANVYDDGNIESEIRAQSADKLQTGIEYYKEMYAKSSYPMSWLYMFERNFLVQNNLLFHEGIIHEDVEFLIRFILKTTRMMYNNLAVYYYRRRENSIMTTKGFNPKKIPSCFKIIETYQNTMKPFMNDDELVRLLDKRLTHMVFEVINSSSDKGLLKKEKEKTFSILRNVKFKGKKVRLITCNYFVFEAFLSYKKVRSNEKK